MGADHQNGENRIMVQLPPIRTIMFIPGNNQQFIDNAPTIGADAICLDLEDSIAPQDKLTARDMVKAAIPKIADRKNKWAFIGTPHKSSRHDLLFQLSDIKPSFSFKTKKFNEKIMGIDEMSEILSSTEFIPCPNGFVHPETYRLYEALECGCIPVVENTYKYYDRLFPGNPFIKIYKC